MYDLILRVMVNFILDGGFGKDTKSIGYGKSQKDY